MQTGVPKWIVVDMILMRVVDGRHYAHADITRPHNLDLPQGPWVSMEADDSDSEGTHNQNMS